MANITGQASWEDVYQIEQTDPVVGGAPNPATGAGITNIPHLQLFQRTEWLRGVLEGVAAIEGVVIAPGAMVLSSDGYLMRNMTALSITPNGTTRAQLEADGLIEYLEYLLNQAAPAGTIQMAGKSSPPDGWLECDGSAVSRTLYGDLFSAIGTTFGAGNGTSTFELPDLRGEFVRGWDNARGVDVGRLLGSFQADELKAHRHDVLISDDTPGTGGGVARADNNTNGGASLNKAAFTGGNETRPRNVALMFIIKY